MNTQVITQTVKGVICAMVKHPSTVAVEARPGHLATVINVSVHSEDLSTVHGPGGRTTEALRQIMRTISTCQGRHYLLDIQEADQEMATVMAACWDDDDDYEEQPTLKLSVL